MIWTSTVRCVAVLIICFFSLAAQTPKPSVPDFPGDESNQPFKPFRIIDNIYYVGTNDLA